MIRKMEVLQAVSRGRHSQPNNRDLNSRSEQVQHNHHMPARPGIAGLV